MPVVVRSGFGAGLWASVISEAREDSNTKVSPLRTFSALHSAIRYGDLQVDLSDTKLPGASVGLLVYLGVNDCSAVLLCSLEHAEPAHTGHILCRARLADASPKGFSLGSEDHYSVVPSGRLSEHPALRGFTHLNGSVPSQIVEQMLRMASAACPNRHPLFLLQSSVIAALLTTDLDHLGKKVSEYSGPRQSPDSEDTLGCSARLFAFLWGANQLGYLDVYRFYITSTTKEGSALLEWLQTATLQSTDSWARDLRTLRAQPFSGPEPALLPLHEALGSPGLSEAFLASTGLVVLDMYSTMCSWFSAAKEDPFNSALGMSRVFTSADQTPDLDGLWNHLKLPLKLLDGTDSTLHARRAMALRLAPKTSFLDRKLYNKIFGDSAPISDEYEFFFAAPSLEDKASPALAGSS